MTTTTLSSAAGVTAASVVFITPSVDEAFYGLAGDIVRAIQPHSEADPRAILMQLLAAFGNAAGRGPHFQVEADQHHLNLNVLIVGETAKARKGVSLNQALRLFRIVEPVWLDRRVQSGLSSGEGLIWAVRDAGHTANGLDGGVADKRLLVAETEFASALKVLERQGNTLSPLIRNAWDGKRVLQSLVKNSPTQATEAHISVVGHITGEELGCRLSDIEAANGFMNRFLVCWVERSKKLPRGGQLAEADVASMAERLRHALDFAKQVQRMEFDEGAWELWEAAYDKLSDGRPGLVGAMLARAEAQVIRLACIYSLMAESPTVRREHLRAALALWRYVEASLVYIFGDSTGERVADSLLRELRTRGATGMTKTEIRDYFQRHKSGEEIDRALTLLERLDLAVRWPEPTGGRTATRWLATEATSPATPTPNPPDDGKVGA
jgi:uncharacterized protein DUF3987